jgi:YbgC/YbaW family acyl-CoA thioester hydrolase
MTPFQDIDLTVYPDQCDTFGHLNQASFLTMFERARWEMLLRGPGIDLFTRAGSWPAVRKATIDYQASAFPGDVLRFTQSLMHLGHTSFTLRQSARRLRDDAIIATAEFVFVCIDRQGKPVAVPDGIGSVMTLALETGETPARVSVNGVSLALDAVGDGPAVLFIHGYPLDRSMWQHQLEALHGWRRIAPDLRGMGGSDAPDLGYSMATYAADLIALLDALGIEQVVLCGLSMGGYVAFEILRTCRERVLGLVLIASRAEADSAEGRKARDNAAATARERGASAIADLMLPKMLSDETPGEIRERVRRVMAATPVAGIVGALSAMRDRVDSSSLLPDLATVPTLIVAGESDRLIALGDVTRMSDGIPGAALRVIPKAGHLAPVEQPEATTRILQDFLDSLSVKPGPSFSRR